MISFVPATAYVPKEGDYRILLLIDQGEGAAYPLEAEVDAGSASAIAQDERNLRRLTDEGKILGYKVEQVINGIWEFDSDYVEVLS